MEEDTTSMYDTSDFDNRKTVNNTIKKSEFTSEIKIGDETVTVVNPAYVEYVNLQIAELRKRCAFLENELNNTKQASKQRDSQFNKAINQINSRFGY